ncbi:hypothetical protein [Pseudonocardia sp. DLS-67]
MARHAICDHASFEEFRSEPNALYYPARVEPLGAAPDDTGLLRGVRTEHLTVGLRPYHERLLAAGLLFAQRHSYTEALRDGALRDRAGA